MKTSEKNNTRSEKENCTITVKYELIFDHEYVFFLIFVGLKHDGWMEGKAGKGQTYPVF